MSLNDEIYDFWDHRTPCTWGSYEEMYKLRYGLQDYMHNVFRFQDFKDKKVLEIGCGAGLDAAEFAKHGANVYATDLTDKAIRHTTELFKQLELDIEIKKADATNLPFDAGVFDLVYAFGVLHHIPDVKKAVSEIYRVLKPDGKCYAMVYNKNSLLYYHSILYIGGVLNDGFRNGLSEEQLVSKYSEAKKGCPYTHPYTEEEALWLFYTAPYVFKHVNIHIEYPVIDTLSERKFKIPNLPRHLGWHLIIQAEKKYEIK